MNRSWRTKEGILRVDIDKAPSESEFAGWYARDFLEFLTETLWHAYPELRSLIHEATHACWKVWTEQQGQEPYFPNVTKGTYREVLYYYFSDLSSRLAEVIRRLFDGTIYEVAQEEPVTSHLTLIQCDWNRCNSPIKELSKHQWHCPKCDVHLTSLLLCPRCGTRYEREERNASDSV